MRFFLLIFVHFMLNLITSSAQEIIENPEIQKDTNSNFMTMEEKFDYLSKKLAEFEAKSAKENSDAINVQEITTSIKHVIIRPNNQQQVLKKQLKQLEVSDKKLEEELSLLELTKNESEVNESDVIGGEVTSPCQSMCETRAKGWTNTTSFIKKLEQIDLCLKEQNDKKSSNNVCKPNPCLHGGKCYLSSTGSDFRCIDCPKRTSGKRCANVDCAKENKCWRFEDTLYAMYHRWLTWPQAKELCENEGMTLAMPKERESTEFLSSQLKPIYSINLHHVWMGLMWNDTEKEWRWVDGSAVGKYTGGWTEMKSAPPTSVFGGFSFGSNMWDADGAKYNTYALCEFRLFAN